MSSRHDEKDKTNTATSKNCTSDNLIRLQQKESAEPIMRDLNQHIADIENQLLSMSLVFGEAQKDMRAGISALSAEQFELAQTVEELSLQLRERNRQPGALENHAGKRRLQFFLGVCTGVTATLAINVAWLQFLR